MNYELKQNAEKYNKRHKQKRLWKILLSVLGCAVVFCTTYVLMMPAIAQEISTYCGYEEHTHTEDCYIPAHTHTEECYSGGVTTLACTKEETKGHTHTEECYSCGATTLTCTEEETEGHTHTEECYSEGATTLTCIEEENEDHTHTEECYSEGDETLVCTKEETEGHIHTEECYSEGDEILVCTQEEIEGHTHTTECYTCSETVLSCTLKEQEEPELSCELEEHTHELICYSDTTADVETAADWEKTFEDVELTSVWADDVLAIAQTQLGYQESLKNYIVLEDGETTKGYTRYGAWYGDTYGDWGAMFVSFCLHYAEVVDIPSNSNCQNWIETLTENEKYAIAADYNPSSGDLVFFDTDGDGEADHVGFVESITEATGEEPSQITTIEGDSDNQVKNNIYDLDDETILGYGILPYQLTDDEQTEVERVIELIDAIPSADQIDEKLAEFEEAGDYEGEAEWYAAVFQQVLEAYQYYSELTDDEKAQVTNADKLLELDYIWSKTTLIDEITSDTPTIIESASTNEFIELNLYDYKGNINTKYNSNKKYPGFQWNGGAYLNKSYNRHTVDYIDFGNSLITDFTYGSSSSGTNGKSRNAQMIGNQGGLINALDISSYGVTNRPIGMSLASSITDTSKDVLSRTLNSSGYPELAAGGSLSYLFTNNSYATKLNTDSIDGLFQYDSVTGNYYYNSRENHAQYNDDNNTFTLYDEIITPNFIVYPFGNFLPLNDITHNSDATQVSTITSVGTYVQNVIDDLINASDYSSNTTKQQLVDMLAMYRNDLKTVTTSGGTAWSTWSAKNAIVDYFTGDGDNPSDDTSLITNSLLKKLYNIDWDVETNFFLGMDMTMNFLQPEGGMTGNDTNGDGEPDYEMVYYFTGDDDVWVYIDGVLFLDLSGIHRHVGGKIDFVKGEVSYYYLDTKNTGDMSTKPYQTYTFAEILSAAGKSTDGLNENGTFKDYTTHEFKFYYMERGSGSSVCRMNFNFPLLRENSISVSKEVSSSVDILGDPDYKFQILAADSNGNKTNNLFIGAHVDYTIYDESDKVVGDGTTDENGVFTLKAGQRAEFTNISENTGKYYVRELLEGTILEQYGNITVSGESTSTNYNVTVGSDTFVGAESTVKNMSDGSSAFRFTNTVDAEKLGTLYISKELTGYEDTEIKESTYKIQVTLDGEFLPVGTTYTVYDENENEDKTDGETRTVTVAGIIELSAKETAEINKILAGTEFTVQEKDAEGYIVTYSAKDEYNIEQTNDGVEGIIKADASVQLIINNSVKGATVTIPGTKSMTLYNSTEQTFKFILTEVTDSTGQTEKKDGISNYTTEVKILNDTEDFQFIINYAQLNIDSLPQTFYYKITEEANDQTLENDTVYVVAVTVSETDDGDLKAEITGMWKDGTSISTYSADYINTLVGSLSLTKQVEGASTNKSFNFTITLSNGNSGLETLPASYPAKLYNSDGTVEEVTVSFTNGTLNLSMMHGETIVIHDIPIGASWNITETNTDGYSVTHTVGGTSGNGNEAKGSIASGTTAVTYINTSGYELPQTGGVGTNLYTVVGILLLIIACLLLLYNHIKHRRKDYTSF